VRCVAGCCCGLCFLVERIRRNIRSPMYRNLRPDDVEIKHQSFGNWNGIRQVAVGIVEFKSSDGLANADKLTRARITIPRIPTVLDARVSGSPCGVCSHGAEKASLRCPLNLAGTWIHGGWWPNAAPEITMSPYRRVSLTVGRHYSISSLTWLVLAAPSENPARPYLISVDIHSRLDPEAKEIR
jgi:hypothetical protein